MVVVMLYKYRIAKGNLSVDSPVSFAEVQERQNVANPLFPQDGVDKDELIKHMQ